MRFDAMPARDEIVLHSFRTAGTQREVVFAGAALVGMALEREGIARIAVQPCGLALQIA